MYDVLLFSRWHLCAHLARNGSYLLVEVIHLIKKAFLLPIELGHRVSDNLLGLSLQPVEVLLYSR